VLEQLAGVGGGLRPFEEAHYPIAYWAKRWGFSPKTVREWLRDEYGPGILRQQNRGRRSKRDYVTIMVSPSAAARVYAKRTKQDLIH
jgi:predicted site-specific integrase-resolvase